MILLLLHGVQVKRASTFLADLFESVPENVSLCCSIISCNGIVFDKAPFMGRQPLGLPASGKVHS
eukprot:1154595-Pelagomonas_calceolata.AAC.9